jgi:DNA-directed RNA polymerase beta subunit
MERDAFIAHGASLTLDDRSRIASDGHVANVCSKCGQIGETTTKFTLKDMLDEDALIQKEECRVCGGPVQKINTTYCYSNLLARELAAVGIKIEHSFAPKEDLISNIDELMIE